MVVLDGRVASETWYLVQSKPIRTLPIQGRLLPFVAKAFRPLEIIENEYRICIFIFPDSLRATSGLG